MSLLLSALYSKCPYYLVRYIQSGPSTRGAHVLLLLLLLPPPFFLPACSHDRRAQSQCDVTGRNVSGPRGDTGAIPRAVPTCSGKLFTREHTKSQCVMRNSGVMFCALVNVLMKPPLGRISSGNEGTCNTKKTLHKALINNKSCT